jgi:hypothetical protein
MRHLSLSGVELSADQATIFFSFVAKPKVEVPVLYFFLSDVNRMLESSGVPRGDAQDACASPPLAMCIPPPIQPERLVMRKDESVGNKKKNVSLFTCDLIIF